MPIRTLPTKQNDMKVALITGITGQDRTCAQSVLASVRVPMSALCWPAVSLR